MKNPNDLFNIQEILNLIINNKPTSNYEYPAIFNKIKNLDRQFFQSFLYNTNHSQHNLTISQYQNEFQELEKSFCQKYQ